MIHQNAKFTIIGGGTAGWVSALAIKRFSDQNELNFTVQIIEPSDLPVIGVGEGTVDSFVDFTEKLGVPTLEMVKGTGASFKHGILFRDWEKKGSTYWHPFYSHSLSSKDILEMIPLDNDFNDVFLNVRLAKDSKSPFKGDKRVSCGFHFDNFLLGKFFKDYTSKLGVKCIDAKVADFELESEDRVKAVVLQDGRKIESDFFIDCSGFRSLLLSEKLKTRFIDFSSDLICNKAIALPELYQTKDQPIDPYTTSTALSSGWTWRIPILNRIGNGYVFSDQFISPPDAEKELKDLLGLHTANTEGRLISFKVGHYEKVLRGNCLAVGLASGFIEPLEATGILFITKTLEYFGKYLSGHMTESSINSAVSDYYRSTRDFIFLHYKLTRRQDTPFWKHVSSIKYPDSLREKMELFEKMSKIKKFDDALLEEIKCKCAPWDLRAFMFVLKGMGFYKEVENDSQVDYFLPFLKELKAISEEHPDNSLFLKAL
jgi:tryptophan 7-halogenase